MPALKIFATQPIIIKDTCNLNINNLLNFFLRKKFTIMFSYHPVLGQNTRQS